MNLKIAGAVYQKEMLEISRDRRTLISMVLMPLIVIPLLFSVMGKFVKSTSKDAEAEASKLGIMSEESIADIAPALKAAGFQFVIKSDLKTAVENKEVAAGMREDGGKNFKIYVDRTRQASEIAGQKASAVLDKIKEQTIRNSLRGSGVPENVLTPFTVDSVNVASETKMGGFIFGTSIGYVVIILMFTGALYPSIDTAAGEKERRTLETLLASPAARSDIIFGKVLACTSAAFITAILALTSMVYSYKNGGMAAMIGDKVRFDILDPVTIALVLLCVLPVALMFASLMVAISFFAKSYKEGQSYLTPLMLIVIFPAVLGMLPGMELTPALALVPIFNVCQVIKQLFLGTIPMTALIVACLANLAYAVVAYVFAMRIIRNEGVLFRV